MKIITHDFNIRYTNKNKKQDNALHLDQMELKNNISIAF